MGEGGDQGGLTVSGGQRDNVQGLGHSLLLGLRKAAKRLYLT
jgi:hypothetical protein